MSLQAGLRLARTSTSPPTIQAAGCSQENRDIRETGSHTAVVFSIFSYIPGITLPILPSVHCAVDVDGWIICCDSRPAAGHRDVRFQQEVCTKLRSRSLFGPHHVCTALFHCTAHTNKSAFYIKKIKNDYSGTMCHEDESNKIVPLTTFPPLITTLQTLHPFSCDEW